MKCHKLSLLLFIGFCSCLSSCKEYLDIVPDNVATLDYAFRMRSTAEKYLYTCYSFLPDLAGHNPARFGGLEQWMQESALSSSFDIARGLQNTNDPLYNYWDGDNGGKPLWVAISQCNIFLDHIMDVPDMDSREKKQWAAEVKALKAYYYFYLLKVYGPIPILKKNIPVSASIDQVKVKREPVDSVFSYIVELLDESENDLPIEVRDRNTELGRMTLPIAKGLKAKVLVYEASPLFNGNTDYASFRNSDGIQLFNQEYKPEKWDSAAVACKEAIDLARSLGYELFQFVPGNDVRNISDTTIFHMNYRGIVTEEWNPEVIWANTNSTTGDLQRNCAPVALQASQKGWLATYGRMGATMNIASLFYTDQGLPIDEDKTWNYGDRFELDTAGAEDKYNIKRGYVTAKFNFDREPRFYGALGFDGGIWWGNGKYDDDDTYWLECKLGQFLGNITSRRSVSGYYVKKLVNYTNTPINKDTYTSIDYPWVMLRLGDLYLLYAEALNEALGPSSEVYDYLNLIRNRAGVPSIQDSWDNYSKHPGKYKSKDGLREIIHRERQVEMAFEGQRFWDLRRWKEALEELNSPVLGWDIFQSDANGYYRQKILANHKFRFKDYFMPIKEHNLIVNPNLEQNPGW